MFHLAVFGAYIDPGPGFKYVAPRPDPMLRIEGNNIVIPEGLNYLVAFAAYSPNIAQARIETPSLRRTVLLEIRPLCLNTFINDDKYVIKRLENPIVLEVSEPMRALAYHTYTGPQWIYIPVWLADGPISPVTEDYFTIRAVGTPTAGTKQWENVTITFDQTLPTGRYAMIGARCEGPSGLFRVCFVGQAWRPGGPTEDSHFSFNGISFRAGGWGVWGEFPHDQPPTFDILTTEAGQPVFYLDLVKIA